MGKNSKKAVLEVLSVLKTLLELGITFLNLQKHPTLKLFTLRPFLEQEIVQINVGIGFLDTFSVAS